MNWTQLLKNEIETSYAATAELLDKIEPDSFGWKPESGSNWMTVGQLVRHITDACGLGCKGFVTGDWGLPSGKTWKDLTPEEMMPSAENLPTIESLELAKDLLAKDKSTALQMVDQAGEDDLANKEIAAPWAPDTVHVLGFHLLRLIQHLERHEGQLFYYLKLQGKPVNTVDLWGQY